MLDFIVMQMSRDNREKGYWDSNQDKVLQRSSDKDYLYMVFPTWLM